MRVARSLLLPFLLLLAVAARGQAVRWDPPGGRMSVGQTNQLQLVCDDCEAKETPAPPKIDGLTLEFAGQSSNMSFINGTYSHSVTYTFAALLTKNEAIEIPAFTVETNKGPITVAAARFDPAAATVGSSGRSLDSAVSGRLIAKPAEVWAGEVFELGYAIQALGDYHPDFGRGAFDWSPDPLTAEDWSAPEPFEDNTGAEARTGLRYHARAIASKPGTYRLNPVKQLVNLSVGVTGFGFFQQRQYQQFAVPSSAPALTVRPLPAAPPGFTGAVGEFKLSSKVVPEKAGVGDPITWTLELSGTGNWPAIAGVPTREVSRDFHVIRPQTKKTPATGKIFDATLAEDAVLIPTKSGTYTLPSVHFVYFDPQAGAYRTLSTPDASVAIAAPPAPESVPVAAGPEGRSSAGTAAATVPVAPNGIPRDPLAGPQSASPPLGGPLWASLLLLPFIIVGGIWLGLARQRAQRTDPQLGRREARWRLAATVAQARGISGENEALRPLLLAWQHDTAILWSLAEAAPGANALPQPEWSRLWAETDRSLYGPSPRLPADWAARAEQALAGKPAPAFSSRQLWLPRNLFPFLVAALCFAGALRARAAEPAAAYRRGDFSGAEQAWRQAMAADPADWSARHNLSLALAQENRWSEAAAQATAAFVQQPQNEAVRWQWALACGNAGFAPEPLAGFLAPGPVQWLAQFAAPGAWQRMLIAAGALAALALGLCLLRGYGRVPHRAGGIVALAALGFALGWAAVAATGWLAYGEAGNTAAVVVWRAGLLRSVPTEADTSQKTAPLPAGSTATVDKQFLGWIRLNFTNGETGWVRRDDVVSLWQ
jgi:hypothetical protein